MLGWKSKEKENEGSEEKKTNNNNHIIIWYKGNAPEKKSTGAAGYDLICNENEIIIPSGQCRPVKTGTYVEIPSGLYGKIESRSSIALNFNCHVVAGIIDSDYRGEIKVVMHNASSLDITFKKEQRIAQIIFLRHEKVVLKEKTDLSQTERQDGGFGSTGK